MFILYYLAIFVTLVIILLTSIVFDYKTYGRIIFNIIGSMILLFPFILYYYGRKKNKQLENISELSNIENIGIMLIKYNNDQDIVKACLNRVKCLGNDHIESMISYLNDRNLLSNSQEESRNFFIDELSSYLNRHKQDTSFINIENGALEISRRENERIEKDILSVKNMFSELPQRHQRQSNIVGPGAEKGSELIRIICSNCDDVIKALSKKVDNEGYPINTTQIADGLKRLIGDARQDTGVIAVQLNTEGVRLYGEYLNQLDRLADILRKGVQAELTAVEESLTDNSNIEVNALLVDILDTVQLTPGDKLKQEERIAELIKFGPNVLAKIHSAILSGVNFGDSGSKYQNAGLLCQAIGEIGGDEAFNILATISTQDSDIFEYKYIREGAVKGLIYLFQSDKRVKDILEKVKKEYGFYELINPITQNKETQKEEKVIGANEIPKIATRTPIKDIKGLDFIEAEREKSKKDCMSQTSYNNINYILVIIDIQNLKIDEVTPLEIECHYDTEVTYKKGTYIWLEFAKGYGPTKNHLTPIDVVDVIPFSLEIKEHYNGDLIGLAEYVKGVVTLPDIIRDLILKWFSEDNGHRPQWNRRPERVRKIIG